MFSGWIEEADNDEDDEQIEKSDNIESGAEV